ncbi:MAG: hypothetical protein ACQCN4_08815 [Candidatus Bathyarchaeia archaeon]|jgi:hypothetical protein
MKLRNLALVAILTLVISTIASLEGANLVSANYFPPPSIEISSPISVRIYNDSTVRLYVRVNALPDESARILHIKYCLDGGANVTLTNLTRTDGEGYWTSTPGVIASGNAFSVETFLDNLSEGNHLLTVYSHAADGKEMSRTIEFTVDYDYVPPQNPFGLPSNFPNGTAALPPTADQTGTPIPTTNTASMQPLENPLPYIIIACVAVSLFAGVFYFRKKSRGFMELEDEEKLP